MQSNNIQVAPEGVMPIVHASQYDFGREIKFYLYDGSTAYTPPVGSTINVEGIKSDGNAFSYECTWSGNQVTFELTQQMTVLAETVTCELRIIDSTDMNIGTLNFKLQVEKSPIDDSTQISDTEIPAIIALATDQEENAEAWAVGTKDGTPVTSDDPQYHNSAKYWANSVGGLTQDSEAWAVGTKDGVPVTSADPQYHNNSKYYAQAASSSATAAGTSETNANTDALKAEGYAVGKQNGTDVASGSTYYHNNAKYYSDQASSSATSADNAADRAEAAVVQEPYIGANGNWFVYDFTTQAYVDTNVDATGPQGQTGPTGNGIASITKTGTSGLVDTYTILYTNGQSTTFTVTNGQNGTGAGDMLAADYDANSTVKNAGGIVAYVAAQISATSLSGLTDVALSNLAAGQTLTYDSVNQKWVNTSLATVATSGAYNDLSGKPTLGTAAAKASTNAVTQSSTDLVESGAVYTELTYKQPKTLDTPITVGGTQQTTCEGALGAINSALSNKQPKTLDTSLTIDGTTETTVEGALGALVTSNAAKATTTTVNNKHKVSSFEVTTSSWSQDTTSQSGTTLQKKTIALSHCYVDSPSVDIGAASGSVLPTTAQQTAYNLLQYVTVDSAIPCLYLYASDVPTDAFYINVEGVD